MYILGLTLRTLAGLIGLVLIYQAIFLYETQEGEFKNKLEELWIRIDDLQKIAISKHTAFMNVIAGYLTGGFNRAFGDKLLSVQAICVSSCYAMASMGFILWIIPYVLNQPKGHAQIALSIFIPCALYGAIPAFIHDFRESVWMKVWIVGFVYLAYQNVAGPFIEMAVLISSVGNRFLTSFPLMILVNIAFGVGLYAVSIMVMRRTLAYISKSASIVRICLVFLLNCIPLLILYLLWKLFLFTIDRVGSAPQIDGSADSLNLDLLSGVVIFHLILILCTMFINIIFLFSTGIFILLALLMICHRALWPALKKTIYLLQKLEIAKRNKVLGATGVALILLAIWKLEWIETAVKMISPFS